MGRPGPAVAPFVRAYTGYAYAGLPPGTHQGLPSGDLTFIVSIEDPIELVAMPGPQGPDRFDAFVGGLHVRPATVAHPGHGAGISVELSPLGARALFGVPASTLASHVVNLGDLLGVSAAVELAERLRTAASWPERFAVLDRLLAGRVGEAAPIVPEVVRAWSLLVASGGRVAVGALADDVGWSRRHLSARFAGELGVAPKEAARVLRFERTCRLLDNGFGLAEGRARRLLRPAPHDGRVAAPGRGDAGGVAGRRAPGPHGRGPRSPRHGGWRWSMLRA